VIGNLLSNAIQFTPEGGRIHLSVSTNDHHEATIEVQDSGAGIDPAFQPYVFEPFRQGEGTLARRHGGLGLGLSVVRQLVELHDGSVAVASAGLGAGTTFTITLPIEEPRSRPGHPAREDEPLLKDVTVIVFDAGDAEEIAAAIDASGGRALVADSLDHALELHAATPRAVLVGAAPPPLQVPFVRLNWPLVPYRLVRSVFRVVPLQAL